MTFREAVVQAKDGAKITRSGRKAWLEFDRGSDCLTLHEGQSYRVRWASCPEDEQAEDWYVLAGIDDIERRLAALERYVMGVGV